MFLNSLIAALRGIKKNKVNLVINLVGLTFGIGAVMVIAAYVLSELNIGKEIGNKNIYRVETISNMGTFPMNNYPTGGYLVENFPTVVKACMFQKSDFSVTYKNQLFDIKQAIFSDSSFFDIITSRIISGNLESFKKIPNSVVLTKSTAKRIFGDDNPIGKILQENSDVMTVVAVIEDDSKKSLNEYNTVVNAGEMISKKDKEKWDNFGFICLLELEHGANPNNVTDFLNKKLAKMNPYVIKDLGVKTRLVAYKDLYFEAPVMYEPFKQGNRMFIVSFILVALFMLIIAIINSISLNRAQWLNRLNEIFVRKANGASRITLYTQLIGETVILNIGGFIFAVGIILVVFPHIDTLKAVYGFVSTIEFISIMLLCFCLIGVVIGLVASFRLTTVSNDKGLKGYELQNEKSNSTKMVLISFQFVVSIVLIIAIIGINKQINFMTHKDIGFQKDNLVEFTIKDFKKYETLRIELLKYPSIKKVAFTNAMLEPRLSRETLELVYDGKKRIETFPMFSSDLYFPDLMGFEIIQGRNFRDNDLDHVCLINETAAKVYGVVNIEKGAFINNAQVMGVIKDYNFASLHQNIEPLVIFGGKVAFNYSDDFKQCVVKIGSSDPVVIKNALSHIETSWKTLSGEKDIEIKFADDIINNMYLEEIGFKKVLNIFTFLIILIALMGLFGVSLSVISKRTKEIGVRKVHGASTFSILKMLNMTFLKWVFIAYIVAIPIAFFVLDKWLEKFAYRTQISWWIFALTGFMIIGIAVFTTSWQSWIAANMNPVKSLKYE
jgi:putative ABC transport system permease protein